MVLYSIMKKGKLFIKKAFFTSLLIVLLASCASTQNDETQKSNKKSEHVDEITVVQPSPEEIFLESIQGIKLEFTKNPPKTKKNKDFSSEYELLVTDSEGNPVPDFEVALILPVKDSNNKITGYCEKFTTDANGCISYMPATPTFACKYKITAYPFVSDNLSIENKDIEPFMAYADYLVESDVTSKGAIMFVFEFTEGGKPSKNSYEILSALRKKGGSMISNGPISDDTSYITASKQKIYKDNYEYVEDQFGYLIGGTVKFANPVEANEDGTYTAHLIADIYGIDMKTGNVIYEETNEYTSTGTNWSKAVESCKEELTAIVVDSIMYGL